MTIPYSTLGSELVSNLVHFRVILGHFEPFDPFLTPFWPLFDPFFAGFVSLNCIIRSFLAFSEKTLRNSLKTDHFDLFWGSWGPFERAVLTCFFRTSKNDPFWPDRPDPGQDPKSGSVPKTPISGKLPFWGQKSDTFSAFRVLVTTWQMSDLGQNLEKPGNH
jgi:hypothetical protein